MMLSMIKNLFRINIQKIAKKFFWRIVFCILNLSLLMSSLFLNVQATGLSPDIVFFFIFFIVSLANMLFLYTKIYGETSVISLLRAIGASKAFIIINNLFEIMLVYLVSFVLFILLILIALFFSLYADWWKVLYSLGQFVLIGIFCVVFSYLNIKRSEKIQKAL